MLKPTAVQKTAVVESHRYSLDITEDLKNIIEQKKNQKSAQVHAEVENVRVNNISTEEYKEPEIKALKIDLEYKEEMSRYDESACGEIPMWQKISDESFESLEKMCEQTVSDPNSTLFKYLNGEAEQRSNNVLVWQKTSDESFEALERMCDKTASDPNSTLFKYLNAERKEDVLAEVKKRSADGTITTNRNPEDELLSKINNCTLLDDVEAPSRMWENTICNDTVLQTSPVKMVGLLRPSTIIEETPDDSANSDISSHLSFRSAAKSAHSDVSSSAYETAHDSTVASNQTDFSNKPRNEELKDNIIDQCLASEIDACEAENFSLFDLLENTIVEPTTLNSKPGEENVVEAINISIDLIDLEKTFGPTNCSPDSQLQDENFCRNDKDDNFEDEQEFENKTISDDSIIEIISDDEEDNAENIPIIDICDTQIKNEITSDIPDINSDTCSFHEYPEDEKENSLESREQLEKSMQFNDTMEEVEFLMKKGMEYMAAEAATKKSPEKVKYVPLKPCNAKATKFQPNSPAKLFRAVVKPSSSVSASKAKPSPYITPAKKTTLTKGSTSASKRFDIDIKPFPKLDIFSKPMTRTKELSSKQQKFSHIISPIGTYMKKTAQTPLMSSINCKTKDYFNSTAILELENESRLYKPQFPSASYGNEAEGLSKLPGLMNEAKPALPKKAYISSDLKHIVDERTPVTIPASKKIQKYLENAMMPAVLRHEGKFKVPGGISNKLNTLSPGVSKLPLKESDTNSILPEPSNSRRNNASLADLSVMSGDVSMYTIMDAQKF